MQAFSSVVIVNEIEKVQSSLSKPSALSKPSIMCRICHTMLMHNETVKKKNPQCNLFFARSDLTSSIMLAVISAAIQLIEILIPKRIS